MRPQLESIAPLENNSFKAFFQKKEAFDFPYHYHPEFELTYIVSSTGVRYTGNRFENFAANDLVLMGPYLPHCWKNGDSNRDPASAIVVQWRSDLLGESWLSRKEFMAIRRLHELSERGLKFSEETALAAKPFLFEVVEEPSAFGRMIKLLSVLDFLATNGEFEILCQHYSIQEPKQEESDRLRKIYQYVDLHYKNKIRLSDVASLVCMAEESFSRFFSKVAQKSFFAFINEYRINVACRLLIETDLQIAQISDQAGYESTSFFFRQFKKHKNCSPQYYRKRFRSTGGYSIPA